MYQKTFNECDLSQKNILRFIYMLQNQTPFSLAMAFPLQPSGTSLSTSKSLRTVYKTTALSWQLYLYLLFPIQ